MAWNSRFRACSEDFQSRLGNDPSTVESEFGYLDFDQRHVIKLNTVLFLPGDWQFGVSASWSSGLPYSVVNRFFATDNFDYLQFRTRFGFVDDGNNEAGERQFVTVPGPERTDKEQGTGSDPGEGQEQGDRGAGQQQRPYDKSNESEGVVGKLQTR